MNDVDDGEVGIGPECRLQVGDAETKGNDHSNSHHAIGDSSPHHGLWQLPRSIFQFLGHVCAGIRTDETPDGGREANEARKPLTTPTWITGYVRRETLGLLNFRTHRKVVNTSLAGA